jgi:hypothetical protein
MPIPDSEQVICLHVQRLGKTFHGKDEPQGLVRRWLTLAYSAWLHVKKSGKQQGIKCSSSEEFHYAL